MIIQVTTSTGKKIDFDKDTEEILKASSNLEINEALLKEEEAQK